MLEVMICLGIGALFGWRTLLPKRILAASSRMMTLGVFFLLLTMGVRIGSDQETLRQLGSYGLQAFLFAFAAILVSLIVVGLFERLFVHGSVVAESELRVSVSTNPYRMTGLILLALIAGIVVGLTIFPAAAEPYLTSLTNMALYFTLFSVGLDLGLNREIWRQIFRLGWHVFLAPIGVAVGSITAGMLIGQLFGWTWFEGGAVGAGFGWYSLSGVLITQLHGVALGTIAFLTNVFREVLSILLVPVLARRVGVLSLVAPGGATTMDTTLPLVASVGPPGAAVVGLVNGIFLSALVPILVPIFLGY